MKFSNLLLFGLIFSIRLLNAQIDFRPGYIVKSSGDTLYGEVDYRSDLAMSSICKFKGANDILNEYVPNDLASYRFIDSKYYVTREIEGKKVFLEYLIKGKVNIYYMRDKKGNHYYIDKEDTILTETPYEEGIKYVGNKQISYETKTHIGILNYYMKDAPQFQSRIQSIKKPTHQNLIKLAEDYHNVVCEGEQCFIYEKSLPPVTIEIGIGAGFISRNNRSENIPEFIEDNKLFNKNLILYLGMPRVNEKLFFCTGFSYRGNLIDSSGVSRENYKIPFTIEYRYSKNNFQPTLGYGFAIEKLGYEFVPITSINFGFKYMFDNIYLSSNVNADFLSLFVLIIPSPYWVSYSVNLEVGYKF